MNSAAKLNYRAETLHRRSWATHVYRQLARRWAAHSACCANDNAVWWQQYTVRPFRMQSQLQSKHTCFHAAPTDVIAAASHALPLSPDPCRED